MHDYKLIGKRIRERRIKAGLSQEKLAEKCDVGTTHISHIETGNCVPSLKIFVSIINALSCSADEILCDEMENAEHIYIDEISDLLNGCTSKELMIMTDTLVALKASLQKKQ
ncbi:MAG: helix-turn-helix transcriptional regulator [Lachnospiraceae bacterium]|nr:helix-turn-helix transcriptional regulator [Lachnospiraceae bacterium]